jgi:hypothetical protein
MLENTELEIKHQQSIETGNTWYTNKAKTQYNTSPSGLLTDIVLRTVALNKWSIFQLDRGLH